MGVSSMKGDFCGIEKFTPSHRTVEYIERINHVSDLSGMLAGVVSALPFYQIFAGRGSSGAATAGTLYNIKSYDWEGFATALKSVGAIKKRMVENIAKEAALYSSGDDGKFWRCFVNAL